MGQGGAPRHAGGTGYPAPGGPGYAAPGYAAAGGRRPPAHGQPGFPGPAGPEAPAQFDGGYAPVIRASEYQARPGGPARPPGFGRPADPAGRAGQASRGAEEAADVYVYRDTGGQPDRPAGSGPDEHDAAYWYDLPGTGSGGGKPHVVEEVRGPFEPLVSSADPPGATPRSASVPAPGPSAAEPAVPGPEEAPAASDQDPAQAQAHKLEQIKDLYLTAEAIGEANVDKHFDQLLAQQRELISEYFKQSSASRSVAAAASQEAQPDGSGNRGPAAAPESAGVAADQPRAW